MDNKTVTLKHTDFTEYAWNIILDRFGVPERQREGWVTSIELNIPKDTTYKLTKPKTKWPITKLEAMAREVFGRNAELAYDDRQKGFNIRYGEHGQSTVFMTEEELTEKASGKETLQIRKTGAEWSVYFYETDEGHLVGDALTLTDAMNKLPQIEEDMKNGIPYKEIYDRNYGNYLGGKPIERKETLPLVKNVIKGHRVHDVLESINIIEPEKLKVHFCGKIEDFLNPPGGLEKERDRINAMHSLHSEVNGTQLQIFVTEKKEGGDLHNGNSRFEH